MRELLILKIPCWLEIVPALKGTPLESPKEILAPVIGEPVSSLMHPLIGMGVVLGFRAGRGKKYFIDYYSN